MKDILIALVVTVPVLALLLWLQFRVARHEKRQAAERDLWLLEGLLYNPSQLTWPEKWHEFIGERRSGRRYVGGFITDPTNAEQALRDAHSKLVNDLQQP